MALRQLGGVPRKGGKVVVFSFAPEGEKAGLVPFDVLSKELTIMGAWVNPYSYSRALDVLTSGQVDVKPLIRCRLERDNIMHGFNMMIEKPEGFMKALIIV